MDMLLVAIVLCTAGIQFSEAALDSIDLLDPIVRNSPAKGTKDDDMFGLSFAVHQFFSNSNGLTREEALSQTTIVVGAPKGQFPGNVPDIPYSGLACRKFNSSLTPEQLKILPDDYIKTCYENRSFGLIYNCSLTVNTCGAVLGDGDAEGPDGLLFDRVGNTNFYDGNSNQLQDKDDQLMGYTMYSSGEYFVACAPLWEYVGSGSDAQPRGNCVYSNRTLTGFTVVRPCYDGSNNNQNDGGFCTAGMGIYVSKNASSPFLAVGTPGNDRSRGGVNYYNNFNNPTQSPDIESNYDGANPNVYDNQSAYYGYYITSGFITSQTSEDFIITSPRFDEYSQLGGIHVVSDGTMLPVMSIYGEQLGEYFGNCAIAVDLNGDGWDDVVVGAPIHSTESLVEVGKVYVYINDRTNLLLIKSAELSGPVAYGRFGYAVAAMGDLNNDGYEDFAVSAPFEGTGVVYIYHGQAADGTGSIVNQQYQQRISGSDLASHVSDISRFGFTLAGEVDVDINEYRDLVVGDYKSQSVFILRSRPVAAVNISIVANVDEVLLTNYDCVDSNGNPIACFDIQVCATYTGKGLTNFNAPYQVEEVLSRNTRRLFFINNGVEESSSIGTIVFTGQGVASCDNITVYIRNGSDALGDISSFEVVATVQQIVRQQPSLSYPSDFSQEPVIISTTGSAMVRITSTCGEDGLCTPDLILNIINITYLDRSGAQYQDQNNLVVGAIDRVDVYLSYSNNGEDASNAFLEFSLPNAVYEHQQVLPQNRFITCNNTTPNEDNANYRCPIQSLLTRSDGTFVIYLRWQVSPILRGNQEDVSINISLLIPTEFGLELNPADNSDVKVTSFIAQSRYSVSLISTTSVNYNGDSVPNVANRASNLGQELTINIGLENDGPSTIFDAVLDIYLPARAEETGDYYYIYPATLSTNSPLITCTTGALNPQQYNVTAPVGKRRRRSAGRHSRSILKSLSRTIRQSGTDIRFNLDCMTDPSSCVKVTCMVDSIDTQSFDVTIVSYVDERFFYRKTAEYHLNVYAESSINNNYTTILSGSDTSNTLAIELVREGEAVESPAFPWYAIAAPVACAIIFVVIIVILLYCFGFFRRKKHEEKGTEDDFEQFASNPFGQGQAQSMRPITDEKNPDEKSPDEKDS